MVLFGFTRSWLILRSLATSVLISTLTSRSSGPRRWVAVSSDISWPRPLTSSVRPHKSFCFSVGLCRRVVLASPHRLFFVLSLAGLRGQFGAWSVSAARARSCVRALAHARGREPSQRHRRCGWVARRAQATSPSPCCGIVASALSFLLVAACVVAP